MQAPIDTVFLPRVRAHATLLQSHWTRSLAHSVAPCAAIALDHLLANYCAHARLPLNPKLLTEAVKVSTGGRPCRLATDGKGRRRGAECRLRFSWEREERSGRLDMTRSRPPRCQVGLAPAARAMIALDRRVGGTRMEIGAEPSSGGSKPSRRWLIARRDTPVAQLFADQRRRPASTTAAVRARRQIAGARPVSSSRFRFAQHRSKTVEAGWPRRRAPSAAKPLSRHDSPTLPCAQGNRPETLQRIYIYTPVECPTAPTHKSHSLSVHQRKSRGVSVNTAAHFRSSADKARTRASSKKPSAPCRQPSVTTAGDTAVSRIGFPISTPVAFFCPSLTVARRRILHHQSMSTGDGG